MTTVSKSLPYHFAKQHQLLAGAATASHQEIFHNQDLNYNLLNEIRRFYQSPLKLIPISEQEFKQCLERNYQGADDLALVAAVELNLNHTIDDLVQSEDLLAAEDDAPIIRLLNALFAEAIKLGASDIHIETFAETVTIRFRIDGMLREILQPQRRIAPLIVSRVKVLAKLNIAEKRLPQDGRIALSIADRQVDVRVSTMPTNHGERVVMRLLDKKQKNLELAELGFTYCN